MIELAIRDELIKIRVLLERILGQMESMSRATVVARASRTPGPTSGVGEIHAGPQALALASC
jgi:hypothetical protein